MRASSWLVGSNIPCASSYGKEMEMDVETENDSDDNNDDDDDVGEITMEMQMMQAYETELGMMDLDMGRDGHRDDGYPSSRYNTS